jgi:RNA polymerase sigma-70 factor, ECF subfamily
MVSEAALDSSSTNPHGSGRPADASALGRLIRRCLPGLRRWAHGRLPRWTRSIADTSDLVHDAVLRTLGRSDALENRGHRALGAYLREAVRNRIRDEHRHVARHGTAQAVDHDVADSAPSPQDEAIAAEERRRYAAALAGLSPADRELIVAHVELDYTHAQLGCMTGRSANAARMALHRAVARLAERMREQ